MKEYIEELIHYDRVCKFMMKVYSCEKRMIENNQIGYIELLSMEEAIDKEINKRKRRTK